MIVCGQQVYAQKQQSGLDSLLSTIPADSTLDLNTIIRDSVVDLGTDYEMRYSYGWFPMPFPGDFNLEILFGDGDIFDSAFDIRPKDFAPGGHFYGGNDPTHDDEREIKYAYTKEGCEDEYPETDYESYLLEFRFSTYFPALINLKAGISLREGILFAKHPKKPFVKPDGSVELFREYGIAHLDEVMFDYGAGFIIPFYGAFIDEFVPVSSFYYIYLGYQGSYPLQSRLTEFVQIGNHKEYLRFDNGRDTVRLRNKITMSQLEYNRHFIDIGLGMEASASNIGTRWELFMKVPVNSVIRDEEWKQYVVGFKFTLGIYGILREIFE